MYKVQIPYSPRGDGNIECYLLGLKRGYVQIPYSPRGDGNRTGYRRHDARLAVQIPYSPRGDGNKIVNIHIYRFRRSDTLFPERGRKPVPTGRQSHSANRSDTLLPERGRKPTFCHSYQLLFLFRYLTPREGTKTAMTISIQSDSLGVQIPHSPQGVKKAQAITYY